MSGVGVHRLDVTGLHLLHDTVPRGWLTDTDVMIGDHALLMITTVRTRGQQEDGSDRPVCDSLAGTTPHLWLIHQGEDGLLLP